jgi:hypothetical protein
MREDRAFIALLAAVVLVYRAGAFYVWRYQTFMSKCILPGSRGHFQCEVYWRHGWTP